MLSLFYCPFSPESQPQGMLDLHCQKKTEGSQDFTVCLITVNTANGFVHSIKSVCNVSHQALQIHLLGHWGVKCLVQFSLLSVSSFK